MTCRPAKELVLSKEKPIPYQPPLPPNEAPSGVDAAAGVTPVGLRPPFVTPAAAHSHPDCRGIPILIDALEGYFPVHLIPAYNLPVYASQRPLPVVTQDSVRGCSLGFAAAVIADGRLQRAFKAQLPHHRTYGSVYGGSLD